ncbi:hypothetical protein ACVBEJ_13855 [Porticoccus sp. GXU_MW_L64]
MTFARLLSGLAFAAVTTISMAAEDTPPQPQPDPTLKAYLDCINTEAQKQTSQGNDKISSAQIVIDACAVQKQALLTAINQSVANQMIVQVEKHLKDREQSNQP